MMCAINRILRRFRRNEDGAVVVDFIPVFFCLIVIVLLIFEIGIAYFLSLRSYKAAQLGARLATVLPAVHSAVPETNKRTNSIGRLGEPCFNPAGVDRCLDPGGPWICDGSNLAGECNVALFGRVVAEMQRTFPDLEAEEVAVTYIYRRLGETGGPFIPEVNIRILPMGYRFLVFNLRSTNEHATNADLASKPVTRYGGVSASAFGENTGS